MGPEGGVAARKGQGVMIKVIPPVQNGVVGGDQHAASIALGSKRGGIGVARVFELLGHGTVLEETHPYPPHLVKQSLHNAVVPNLECSPFSACLSYLRLHRPTAAQVDHRNTFTAASAAGRSTFGDLYILWGHLAFTILRQGLDSDVIVLTSASADFHSDFDFA